MSDNDDGAGGGDNTPTVEELQAQLGEMQKSNDSLIAKNGELLTETKTAKTKKREIEVAAEAERERVAKENGDHEQLYNSAMEANKVLKAENDEIKGGIATEKRDNAAMKIATELADGANVKLLSKFIAPRLKYTEEGLKVTDAGGQLTVSTISDLATEFKNNADYASLLKGNQSSGGGASGGSNSGGAAKVKSRDEFDALNQNDRMTFTKAGGKITN